MQAMSKRRRQSRGRKKQGRKRTAAVDIRPNVRALATPTEEDMSDGFLTANEAASRIFILVPL